jgi:hypothetical protein
MGLGAAAAVGVAGSVAGGLLSSQGAKSAANTAAGAQNASAALQAQEFQQALGNQMPYIQAGYPAANMLLGNVGQSFDPTTNGLPLPGWVPQAPDGSGVPNYSWNAAAAGGTPSRTDVNQFSWNPTQQGLEQTPGYQFTLDQGLKSAQNAAAARGLGVSGAALKASDTYATGLANSTYNQQLQNAINTNQAQNAPVALGNTIYNNQVANSVAQNQQQLAGYQQGLNTYTQAQLPAYQAGAAQFQNLFQDTWANQQNRYNQLMQLAQLGANTSVSSGSQGVQSAANVGNALSGAGASQAAGQVGSANALSGAFNNIQSNPYVNNYLQQQFGSGGGGYAGGTGTGLNYTQPNYGFTSGGINAGISGGWA